MIFLIKFDENGRRNETYVKEEKTESQIEYLLSQGFLEISEAEYDVLIGNVDGREHVRNPDASFKPYVPSEPTEEAVAAQVRAERDRKIAESDYLAMPDYPLSDEDKKAVMAYRQALRDIPTQEGFPCEVVWPEAPAALVRAR